LVQNKPGIQPDDDHRKTSSFRSAADGADFFAAACADFLVAAGDGFFAAAGAGTDQQASMQTTSHAMRSRFICFLFQDAVCTICTSATILKVGARNCNLPQYHYGCMPSLSRHALIMGNSDGMFMYTLDQAVDVVESVLRKRPLRLPRFLSVALLVRLLAWISRGRVLLARGPASART
jgi:hypothetical protein